MAAYSYSVLAVAAAKRGDGEASLRELAEEQSISLPAACVVGLLLEDQRRAVVARDRAGKTVVHYDENRRTPAVDAATSIPDEIRTALIDCETVDVIARAPIHGKPRLFGDDVAWRFLAQHARPRERPLRPTRSRSLVVANVEPPTALALPRLATWSGAEVELITGSAATPSNVLAAIGVSDEVTIHAHGLVDVAQPDASFIALSPEIDGRFAMTVADVRQARFQTSPLIILAACRASQAAPVWHEVWSLPAAFVYAGARGVVAAAAPIPDAEAGPFFDELRHRAEAGVPVAIALRDVRKAWLAKGRGTWVRDVIVFE
jgi:hypothetical protein